MKPVIRIAAFLCAVLLLSSAVGCKKDYRGSYIYFELPEKPETVDAQTATDISELLIVRNIYEGLLRENETGALVNGAADSFEKDGLVYTFHLRQDAVWSNGYPLTANDFVFALRRAVNPVTASPFVSRLFTIQNAQSIFSGGMNCEELGVSAVDEHTLVITLIKEDENFENTLTTSVCMPCNEQFFNECVGKYGLESRYIISNGSYSLTKWNKDDFGIRLYKNDEYNGTFIAGNAAVFLSCVDDSEPLELLGQNSVDISFINCSDKSTAEKAGLKTESFENICWVMTVSTQYSQEIREAFAKLTGAEIYSKSLPEGYRAADSLFPAFYSPPAEVSGAGVAVYDFAGGKTLFAAGISKLKDKKLPQTVLTYYDDGNIKAPVTDIVGHWQQHLGAYINIEAVDDPNALISQLSDRTCQLAVFPVAAGNLSVSEYLRKFGVEYTGQSLAEIQTGLIADRCLVPIAFENTTVAYTSFIHEIRIDSANGCIDFSFVVKIE